MPKSELIAAIEQVCEEKNIPFDSVVDAIEAALAVAYRKEFGNKLLNCKVEFNPEDASSRIYDVKTVVEDPKPEELEALAQAEAAKEDRMARGKREEPVLDGTTPTEEEVHRFNPRTDIAISEAMKIKTDAEIGDEIVTELPIPDGYGRVAAQTAKQVIIQKLREAERDTLFNQYKDRVGEIVNATVQRVEGPMVFMDLGHASALMPPSQQNPKEQYRVGDRYKVYLAAVEQSRRGPEILASRTAPEMVKAFFEMEVPELASGSIEIKCVSREAGSRTKMAVMSHDDSIDPIGSCVGQRGARVQTVMNELGGEKIDIIEYSDDPVRFIVNALSPAKVLSVLLNDEERHAKAFVGEDQLSLAIGKGGQNVRLAAKLTGWKIDVLKDETLGSDTEEDTSEETTSHAAAVSTEEASETTTVSAPAKEAEAADVSAPEAEASAETPTDSTEE